MNLLTLCQSGLEDLAVKEVKELVGVSAKKNSSTVSFSTKDILNYLAHAQAARRVLVAIGWHKVIKDIDFSQVVWKDFFTKKISFKITVEGVKGQDNRIAIARDVLDVLFPLLREQLGFEPEIDLKKPDLELVIFNNDTEYFVGIDLAGEMNNRAYRVFPHQASLKGDIAYHFLRTSGFTPDGKLLVGFCKDGTLPIEAALFAGNLPVRAEMRCKKFPLFSKEKITPPKKRNIQIFAFAPGFQNFSAARKNAAIAGVKDILTINKLDLDELDVRFDEKMFDNLIFHLTTKDEDKLNEIYYQASYLLKSKGTLLFIAREQWDCSVSEKFSKVSTKFFTRGESTYKLTLLEKK